MHFLRHLVLTHFYISGDRFVRHCLVTFEHDVEIKNIYLILKLCLPKCTYFVEASVVFKLFLMQDVDGHSLPKFNCLVKMTLLGSVLQSSTVHLFDRRGVKDRNVPLKML